MRLILAIETKNFIKNKKKVTFSKIERYGTKRRGNKTM